MKNSIKNLNGKKKKSWKVVQRQFFRNTSFVLVALIFLMICGVGIESAEPKIISEFNFEDSAKREAGSIDEIYTADDGIPQNIDISAIRLSGASFTGWVQGSGGLGTFAPSSNRWDSEAEASYWYISFSTLNYGDLWLSSKQRSSDTGPRDFIVQCSLDGTSWWNVAGAVIVVANDFTFGVIEAVSLPIEMENQEIAYLRWIKTTNTSVNGGTVGSTGTNRIDDILVGGEPLMYTIDYNGNGETGGMVPDHQTKYHGVDLDLHGNTGSLVKTGYSFTGWNTAADGNGAHYDEGGSFAEDADTTLYAYWTSISYDDYVISATADPTEGGSITGAGTYSHGDSVTLTATANEGYHFVNWTEGASVVSSSASYGFTATADRILVANFALNDYVISATADPTEGGSITGAGTYSYGDSVTLTATANEGYHFVNWTEGGTVVSTSSNYEFTADRDRELVVRFAMSVFAIDVTSDPINGGNVTGAGNYEFGSNVTLIAQPSSGYQFTQWTESGEEVSTEAEYSFTAESDRSLIAHFALREYSVSAVSFPSEGGHVSGGGTYTHGDLIQLTATAHPDFYFLGWREVGIYFSTENNLSFSAESDRTVEAVFSPTVPGELTQVLIPENEEGILEFPELDVSIQVSSDQIGTVTVTKYGSDDKDFPTGQLPTGVYLGISLSDSLAGSNVRIEVGYDPSSLPVELDETALRIWHYDDVGEAWTALAGGVDTDRKVVWAETNEFSTFGVFGSFKTAGRISGSNRYQTAIQVSQAGWPVGADTVVLARADNYADALAGVPLAYLLDAPILLTATASIGNAVLTEIERLGAEKVILLGGTGAISENVANTLEGRGLTVERIAGSNRYGTAVLIGQAMVTYGAEIDTAVIAVGTNFPDALAAASYAAMKGQPILLTGTQTLAGSTRDAIVAMNITNTIIVGGTSVISQAVEDDLKQYGSVVRLSGTNRYATAVSIAEHYDCDTDRYYIATGLDFPDAITGAVLAAKRGTGVLLVHGPGTVPNEVARDYVAEQGVKTVGLFGGNAVISASIEEWFVNNL